MENTQIRAMDEDQGSECSSREEFYVEGGFDDDEDRLSLYDRLTEDGSYLHGQIEEIVAYLVSSDGVETRGAWAEKKGSSKGKKKKTKIRYFKGERLVDCFPNNMGEVPAKDDARVRALGMALLAQNFAVEYSIQNKKARLMAPVEASVWRPGGFYVWTALATDLVFEGDEADFIQVVGGSLRRRRRNAGAEAGKGMVSAGAGNRPASMSMGGANGPNYLKVERVGQGSRGGINWLHIFLLFILFGPPIMMAFMYVSDFVSESPLGVVLGLRSTPRDRLLEFYSKHNPAKATSAHVDKLLAKNKGRETELFSKLERTYEERAKRRERIAKAQEEDRKYEEQTRL